MNIDSDINTQTHYQILQVSKLMAEVLLHVFVATLVKELPIIIFDRLY